MGKGFLCLGIQGTMAEIRENGSMALIRMPGLEYFCSNVLYDHWLDASANGKRLNFPQGTSIVLKSHLRLPPRMKKDVLDVLAKKIKSRVLNYMLGYFPADAVSYRGFRVNS